MGDFVGNTIFKVIFNGITQPLMRTILEFAQVVAALF